MKVLLAILTALAILCFTMAINWPLAEDLNFKVTVVTMQFATLMFVLTHKFDNEKKD